MAPSDEETSPVVRALNAIFAEAMRRGATHIHITPDDTGVSVRLRIEGQMHDSLRLPRTICRALTGRLKNLGHLDVAERALPQHGRFILDIEGQGVEFTISTLPLGNSDERIVLERTARSR